MKNKNWLVKSITCENGWRKPIGFIARRDRSASRRLRRRWRRMGIWRAKLSNRSQNSPLNSSTSNKKISKSPSSTNKNNNSRNNWPSSNQNSNSQMRPNKPNNLKYDNATEKYKELMQNCEGHRNQFQKETAPSL